MNARNSTQALQHRLATRSINLNFDDANTLRRAQITLQRWAEMECGDSGPFASWSIENTARNIAVFFAQRRRVTYDDAPIPCPVWIA